MSQAEANARLMEMLTLAKSLWNSKLALPAVLSHHLFANLQLQAQGFVLPHRLRQGVLGASVHALA